MKTEKPQPELKNLELDHLPKYLENLKQGDRVRVVIKGRVANSVGDHAYFKEETVKVSKIKGP